MKRTLKRHPWWVIGGITALVVGASVVYANYAEGVANKGVTITPHVMHPNAPVTLTEYSDFACPACEEAYPTISAVLKQYGDKIRFEYRYFPLIGVHPNAVPSAIAAETAAQQGKFFEMYDQLFQNANQWVNAQDPQPYFLQYAQKIGLNMDQFRRQLGSTKIRSHIMQAYQEARQKNLTSTPTFFLNGQQMKFTSLTQFKADIAAAVGATGSSTATSSVASSTSGVKFGY